MLKKIVVQRVNAGNFKGLGQLIKMPNNSEVSPTAFSESYIYYGILAVMDCTSPVQFGIYHAEKRDMIVKQLEQHKQTEEFLFAIEGDFIVPAAISKKENGIDMPDCAHIYGFMVGHGEGIIFNKGIWHSSPISATDKCTVIVAFKHNTHIEDVAICNLEEDIRMVENLT